MSIELFNQINIMATVQFLKWTPIFIVNFSTIFLVTFDAINVHENPMLIPEKTLVAIKTENFKLIG